MAKVAPDYSFVRDGVPLREWLWRLVGDDRAARRRAGEVLGAMQWGIPSAHTQFEDLDPIPDMSSQSERFNAAVRAAVVEPGFDTADFVTKLCIYKVATSDDWLSRVARAWDEREDTQFDRIARRLVERVNSATDPALRDAARKRFSRALAASCTRDCQASDRMMEDAEAMSAASQASYAVFNALGVELLAAPEALQLVLEHRQESHQALRALARIGPPAIAFAPQLIERMDHQPSDGAYYFDGDEALGSIGRGHGGIVDALLERLRSSEVAVRCAAAATLAVMGTDVAGRTTAILARLHAMHDAGDMAGLGAMASIGRDDPPSRRRVIDLARPRPPRMQTSKYGEVQDAVMFDRGHAIYAMRYFVAYPDECVPVLTEAIDTFDEYNPDETYAGPVARVANALAGFGSAAGAAALPLARHLEDTDSGFPRAILAALSAMGPAAAAALPALETFRARLMRDDPSLPDLDLTGATAGPDDDPVGVVILRIRGALNPRCVGGQSTGTQDE